MTTELERLARAAHETLGLCHGTDPDPFQPLTWEDVTADEYQPYAEQARYIVKAFLCAMQPTEAQVEVVARAIHDGRGLCHGEDDENPFRPITWEEVSDDDYPVEAQYARDLARAAITAFLNSFGGKDAACDCGKSATTNYDGDQMCEDCAEYCARRDAEEDDMRGEK